MAMTGVSELFVDTNVLIYATDPASPLHRTAVDTLQCSRQMGVDLLISPQILREYLAAATRSAVTGSGSSIDDVLKNFRDDGVATPAYHRPDWELYRPCKRDAYSRLQEV